MKNIKQRKLNKAISMLVVFAIIAQMTLSYANIIVAKEDTTVDIQNLDASATDRLSVSIEGVSGTSEGVIALGKIKPIAYDGYEFVNATVDNAIVNYVGMYEGEYYYANTDDSEAGAYLLGDLKVKLNYKKTITNYAITYMYDENVVNIVGDDSVNETKTAKFRIEMLLSDYEIVSVKANETLLTADADGYYYVENDGTNKTVVIETKKTTEYKAEYNTSFIDDNIVSCQGASTVKSGDAWTGTIILRSRNAKKYTLNSIMLNDVYLNIPNGANNDSKTTTMPDNTEVIVQHTNGGGPLKDHTYKITVKNVKSNLKFAPVLYGDIYDITMTNIEGLDVYHWNGKNLDHLSKGDVIYKNDGTDYFFVKTEPGFEAELESITGEGSKIIEKIDVLEDSAMKDTAKKLGCNYVFYYSDKSVKKRTANITSSLIQYNVTYDVVDIADDKSYNILDNNIITLSSIEPTKSGYSFVGWKLQDNDTTYQAGDEIILNEKLANALKTNTIALKAQWVKNEDMKTSSYQIRYYFQQDNKEYVENKDLRKTIKNAPIGATAFLMDKDPIGEYEFDASNENNVLSTLVRSENQTTSLRAYYVAATREVTYRKGNAKEGSIPVDELNPYKKGSEAIVLENEGNLVGDFKSKEDQVFVCWKTSENNYYYPGDTLVMDRNVTLSPVFVGDLDKENVVLFTSSKNGKIEGRNKFAVPKNHSYEEVLKDVNQLPNAIANTGYKFDGWYYDENKIASDNVSLFNEIKQWKHSGTLEARFIVDESLRHNISYKVNYYLGDTIKDSVIVSDNNVPLATKMLTVRDLDVSENKYDGYKFSKISPKDIKNGNQILNGSTINVYYVKDEDQWTSVKFSAGKHGTVDEKNYVTYKDVLIGKTFGDQKIQEPTIKANKGWIVSDEKWDIEVSNDTVIEKNLTITAQYKEDKNNDGIADEDQYVNVTFNAGDHGNYAGETTTTLRNMLPGDTVTAPTPTTDRGFVFVGYDKEVIKEISADTTIKTYEYTAQYKEDRNNDGIADEDQYVNVTFNAGDHGNYAGETTTTLRNMLPGDSISIPEIDVDAGYTFTRYDKDVLTTIPKDSKITIEYTAQYVQNPIIPDANTPDANTPVAPGQIVNDANAPVVPAPVVPAPVQPAPVVPAPNVPNDNVVVEDNETPKANDKTVIKDKKTPLAKSNQEWALINLVLAIATVLLGAWNILSKNKENDDNQTSTTKRILKIGSGLLAIISVFAFVMTQNMTTTMAMYDKWSLLMIAFALVQIAFVVYVKNIKKSSNNATKETV